MPKSPSKRPSAKPKARTKAPLKAIRAFAPKTRSGSSGRPPIRRSISIWPAHDASRFQSETIHRNDFAPLAARPARRSQGARESTRCAVSVTLESLPGRARRRRA